MGWTIHRYQPWLFSLRIFLRMLLIPHYCLIKSKGLKLQQCFLLDVAFLNSLFIQVLDELLPLHPVDEWAGVAAVAEERPARQVQSASCKDDETTRWCRALTVLTACYGHGSACISLIMNTVLYRISSSPQICAICRAKVSGEYFRCLFMVATERRRGKKNKREKRKHHMLNEANSCLLCFLLTQRRDI